MKKVFNLSLSAILIVCIAFGSACADIFEDSPLAVKLESALKTYLESDEFNTAVVSAKTTQSRLPLLYLRYVKGDFYSEQAENDIKGYLSAIDELTENGEIKDGKYAGSSVKTTGWYGVIDYLYSFSLLYNQYEQILFEKCGGFGSVKNEYESRLNSVKNYIHYADSLYTQKTIEFDGAQVRPVTLMNNVTNAVNNFTSDRYRLDYETLKKNADAICAYTGKNEGFAEFLAKYKTAAETYADMTAAERNAAKAELQSLWTVCVPSSRCAFGYSVYNTLFLIAVNLGFDYKETVPSVTEFMLSYYEKDENGNFKKDGGTPNWVGFSGRPLAGAALRNEPEYSLVYEKTMQGYFPFTDGWNQPLDEMINMDRLCNYYNHDLKTGSNVAPFYGLLYGYMNGIDMEHYKKEVYHSAVCTDPTGENCKYHINEQDGQIYNIVSMWTENLKTDDEGNIVLSSVSDMAVAIAYLAKYNGIATPSPIGVYNAKNAVIKF